MLVWERGQRAICAPAELSWYSSGREGGQHSAGGGQAGAGKGWAFKASFLDHMVSLVLHLQFHRNRSEDPIGEAGALAPGRIQSPGKLHWIQHRCTGLPALCTLGLGC